MRLSRIYIAIGLSLGLPGVVMATTVTNISHSMTINVPGSNPFGSGRVSSVQQALNLLRDKRITRGYVTIRLTQDLSNVSTITINHPDSRRIILSGGGSYLRPHKLQFSGAGIRVIDGHTLGGIRSIKLVGPGAGRYSCGVRASDHSKVKNVDGVRAYNFKYGFCAYYNSVIDVNETIFHTVSVANLRAGFYATGNSKINLSAYSSSKIKSNHNKGYGYLATMGSTINAHNFRGEGNKGALDRVYTGGQIVRG
ncbi:hypothetical protein [Dongshaea marina]|uniref:hypothetical protein n=1 Tax=Dongshaea marina TaxID=2047966 RepID=UPI001F2F5EEA|nr:hypothetical protein [Dongshaea marina]